MKNFQRKKGPRELWACSSRVADPGALGALLAPHFAAHNSGNLSEFPCGPGGAHERNCRRPEPITGGLAGRVCGPSVPVNRSQSGPCESMALSEVSGL